MRHNSVVVLLTTKSKWPKRIAKITNEPINLCFQMLKSSPFVQCRVTAEVTRRGVHNDTSANQAICSYKNWLSE